MTERPPNLQDSEAGAPSADSTSLALARTQRAVVRLAKHLKIDLSDENQRNSVIARAQNNLKAANSRALALPAWEKVAALYPAKPRITLLYVQEALNTYQEIDALTTNPE
jgi:hypothetical protein